MASVSCRLRIPVKIAPTYPGSTSYLLSGWFSLFGPDSYSNFLFQLWANSHFVRSALAVPTVFWPRGKICGFLDTFSVPACLNDTVTSWFDAGELFEVTLSLTLYISTS